MTNLTRKLSQEHVDFLNSLDWQYTSDTAAWMLRDQFDIDISGSAVRYQWKMWRWEGEELVDWVSVMDTWDKKTVSTVTEHIQTVEQLLSYMDISQDEREVDKSTISKSDRAITVWEKEHKQIFRITVYLKKKPPVVDMVSMKEELLKEIGLLSTKTVEKRDHTAHCNKNNLLVLNIFDAHIEKACYLGDEDFDTIYEYKNAVIFLLEKARNENVSSIVFPIGNDFFNSDNHLGTTTGGTHQDNMMARRTAFKKGRELISWTIEQCTLVAPVRVLVIPWNHDYTKSFYLWDSLEMLYIYHDGVFVDNGHNPRKYHSFGKNLIGFTHWSEEKREDLVHIMNTENQDGEIYRVRDWYTGHFHKEQIMEIGWVRFYQESSLTPPDERHNKKWYIGNRRSATARVYSRTGW